MTRYAHADSTLRNQKSQLIKSIDVVRVMQEANLFLVMGRSGKYRHVVRGKLSDGTFLYEEVFKQNNWKPVFLFPRGKRTREYDLDVEGYKEMNRNDLESSNSPVSI